MQEYKAHYASLVANEYTKEVVAKDCLKQAKSQMSANDERNRITGRNEPIEWHFDERETATFAHDIFKTAGYLKSIKVYFTPYWPKNGARMSEVYPDE